MNRREALIEYRAKLVKAHEFAKTDQYYLLTTPLNKAGLGEGDYALDRSHPLFVEWSNSEKYDGSQLWLDSIAHADKLIAECK